MTILLLGGIGYLIFTVAFQSQRGEDKVAATPSRMKLQQQDLSDDLKLEQMLNSTPSKGANFLAVIKQMSDFEVELDKIEASSELTESQKFKMERIRIRNKSVVVMTMTRKKIDCKTEKSELYRYCEQRLDSSDEQVRETARFWLCAIPTIEFTQSPSEENYQKFADAVTQYPEGYLLTPEHAATLSALLYNMGNSSAQNRGFALKGYRVLIEQFANSKLEEVQRMGVKLESLAVFGSFNLPTLAYRIMWGDPTGSKDLEGALTSLLQNPDADLETWVTLIRAYESYLAIDKIEETGTAWTRIWDLSNSLPESEKKTALQKILNRQRARAVAIGSPFDTSGFVMPNKQPFDRGEKDFVLVVFCDKGSNSLEMLVRIGKAVEEQQIAYHPVLAFEQELTKTDIDSLHMVPREISIASFETSQKYAQAFPTDFFPYLVLIDKNGNIIAANVDIDQVPTRIAKVRATAKRENAANATQKKSLDLQSQ